MISLLLEKAFSVLDAAIDSYPYLYLWNIVLSLFIVVAIDDLRLLSLVKQSLELTLSRWTTSLCNFLLRFFFLFCSVSTSRLSNAIAPEKVHQNQHAEELA